MKKILLSGLLVFFALVGAQAQTSFGIKAGLNVANEGGDAKGTDPITSFHLGGFASTAISSRFGFQPELLYSLQGYKLGKYTVHYHYLNIPLIFKIGISGGLHAQLGPQFGILLDASQEEGKTSIDITDDRNKYDGAIAVGLGYDLSRLQFSARYNFGVSDTRDSNEKGVDYTNNVLQISLGFRF
ncbi:MAG: porin family protein [Rufibacter sp.]